MTRGRSTVGGRKLLAKTAAPNRVHIAQIQILLQASGGQKQLRRWIADVSKILAANSPSRGRGRPKGKTKLDADRHLLRAADEAVRAGFHFGLKPGGKDSYFFDARSPSMAIEGIVGARWTESLANSAEALKARLYDRLRNEPEFEKLELTRRLRTARGFIKRSPKE